MRMLFLALLASSPLLSSAVPTADCTSGLETCDEPEELQGSSLLMSKFHTSTLRTQDLSCAPLNLPGFQLEDCDNVAVGSSCKVSCPAGLVGDPVRYFCYAALADDGQPPAALHPPVCFNTSASEFTQGRMMQLQWGSEGCLYCPSSWNKCEVVPDAVPGDQRCTTFEIDLQSKLIRSTMRQGTCLVIYRGATPGFWSCRDNADYWFTKRDSDTWVGGEELCVSSGRGEVCVKPVGTPKRFIDVPLNTSLLQPPLTAAAAGDGAGFLRRTYALQTCLARLDTPIPDNFWTWLKSEHHVAQSLFSTFPVNPNQLKIFHAIREFVGEAEFQARGMSAFAVAVSYTNRFGKSIKGPVAFIRPNQERNGFTYLKGDEERMRQEMREGLHCRLQSNECRDLHKCCGAPETWKFKWPRDPTPSVEDWVSFWLNKTAEHPEALWGNPVTSQPWIFGVYLWPSPLSECEWVQRKLVHGEPMEGRWYFYRSDFHENVCAGGAYHPDSIPGIAVYGGVCGRMSQISARSKSCMGSPATQKGEPGHAAGFQFVRKTAIYTYLNTITDVSNFSTLQVLPPEETYVYLELATGSDPLPTETTTCLKCRSYRTCTTLPAGSSDCTQFSIDTESSPPRVRVKNSNQCLTMRPSSRADLTRCWGTPSAYQDVTMSGGNGVITGDRGTLTVRPTAVPVETNEGCLKCTSAGCGFADVNSSDCTLFEHDAEMQLIRLVSLGRCLNIDRGPKVGHGRCSTRTSRQRTFVTEEGYLRVPSDRGVFRFKPTPAKPIESERGRCLVCATNSYGMCNFAAANSTSCTEFAFDSQTHRVEMVEATRQRCLYMSSSLQPATTSCGSTREAENLNAVVDEHGRLKFESSRGKMFAHVVDGALPNVTSRWRWSGFHGIKCPKSRCHYTSLLGLGGKSEERWSARHAEAAKALVESWNDQETNGVWPTAYDEARLAASMVYAAKRDGLAELDELEPLLAWALRRNPALYEAWELAADFPVGGPLGAQDMPSRDNLPSRQWYHTLEALSLGTRVLPGQSKKSGSADRFAREHLADEMRWLRFPQLREAIIGRLCGVLSPGILEELGEASEQCLLLQSLSRGEGWVKLEADLLAEDAQSDGNLPSDDFSSRWELLARLALAPEQHDQSAPLEQLLERLLESLSVGHINSRSQTFFAEHKRVLLRGPYAQVLQLAGVLLPAAKREELLKQTTEILEHPAQQPGRMLASPSDLKDGFMAWVAAEPSITGVMERASVADDINGVEGDPNPEIMDELALDRDEQLELGSGLFRQPGEPEEGDERDYDIGVVLQALLRLDIQGGSEEPSLLVRDLSQTAEATSASEQQQGLHARSFQTDSGPSQTELVSMCVDHLLSS